MKFKFKVVCEDAIVVVVVTNFVQAVLLFLILL